MTRAGTKKKRKAVSRGGAEDAEKGKKEKGIKRKE